MQIEVNRLVMLEAAKTVARVAPSNSPVDVIRGILIESDDNSSEVFMTATNHEVSIRQKVMASVEESGSMLVNARLLVDMMSKLDSEFVSLSADRPERLQVKGGSCTFQIHCMPPKGYPKPIMPFPEESSIMTGICSLAKRTTFLVSQDEHKPTLQCVQIKLKNNAVHAVASDGNRLMLIKDTAEQSDEREFLLPGHAFQLLASISSDSDVFEVGDIDKVVVFVRGDMIFTIRKLATGDYIDTAKLLKELKPLYAAIAEVSKIKEALGFINVAASVGTTREPVNIVFSDGEIILRRISDYSDGTTSITARVPKKTSDTGFFYDGFALLKLFQVLNGKVKLEIDARGLMVVKTTNEAYFQAPLAASNVKARSVKKEKARAKGAEDVKELKEAA